MSGRHTHVERGALSGWAAPKDVILYLAGVLTVSGGTNAIIEYFGPGAGSISCTGKASITNMGAELGATTSIFAYDARMARYLQATGHEALAKLAETYQHLLRPDEDVEEHPEHYFDRIVEIDPKSERLQLLEPWPAWDGHDFLDMPVLVKAKGKTTTDAISPAGPWLRYRGHLDKFSDNMFMGAINAWTDEAGKGLNVLTGARPQAFAQVARDYQAKGVKWVVIGDHNYGEGSSREHAALSPRLLGGVAVIARSFARIHETNLKKQGLLALTFHDPVEYDLVCEDDRVSLVGLAALVPGKPVQCLITHADGTTDTLLLNHSYGAAQVAWFKVGSALNLFH